MTGGHSWSTLPTVMMVIHRFDTLLWHLPYADMAEVRDQLINVLLAARDTVRSLPATAENALTLVYRWLRS